MKYQTRADKLKVSGKSSAVIHVSAAFNIFAKNGK